MNDMTVGIIICGGKGTRFSAVLPGLPKALAPFGSKRLIDLQLELMSAHGIRTVHVMIGHLGEMIRAHVGNGTRYGLTIRYFEDNAPCGTAGCLSHIEPEVCTEYIVLYGDLVCGVNLTALIVAHRKAKAAATLVVHPNNHPQDSDLVEINEYNFITAFHGKKVKRAGFFSNLVNAALYALSPRSLQYISRNRPSDFIEDIFPKMLAAGELLFGYKTAEYIKDMGTPERYREVQHAVDAGFVTSRAPRAAIFIDRDGTIIEQVHHLHRINDLKLYPFAARAIRQINQANYLAFAITNHPMVAFNLCNIQTVHILHRRLETELAEGHAYLNDIYFCPHHPERGHPEENIQYKIECICRKPKTGLVDRATSEYNIDLKRSWFIGDSTRDIQTGKNAGMQTILVKTGFGGSDALFDVKANKICRDLEEAVNVILEGS